jgi:hypothetical protein
LTFLFQFLLSFFSGRSLAAVRERVERQRSVTVPPNINSISIDISGSLDELTMEPPAEKKNIRNSVERLDTQVSTLHQDVATLSIEVRNAIQALQEMTFSTMHSQPDLGSGKFQPARSIPNLQNPNVVHAITDHYVLARSSSHPPEIWGRQISIDDTLVSPTTTEKSFDHPRSFAHAHTQQEATQTDNVIDYETLEKIVLANPRIILRMLGIEMVFRNECEVAAKPSNLHTIPEVTSSPECSTPNIHELIHDHQQKTSNWSIDNSNVDNCRSTEALLAGSYDDVEAIDSGCITINVQPDHEPYPVATTAGSFCNIVTSSFVSRKDSKKEKKEKNYCPDFEETDDRCALLKNDQASPPATTATTPDVPKRNGNLFVNRVPPNYRFSAGDADTLEKGQIAKMLSSRSLRDS